MPIRLPELPFLKKFAKANTTSPAEPVSTVVTTQPEPVVKEKTREQLAAEALRFVTGHADLFTSLVDISTCDIDQATLVNAFIEKYKGCHLNIEELLKQWPELPEEDFIIITSYSPQLIDQDRKLENSFQQVIRNIALQKSENGVRHKSVLILTQGLPNFKAFHDPGLPWFNGPFDRSKDIWSLHTQGDLREIDLILQKELSEKSSNKGILRSWAKQRTYQFK